VVTVCWEEPSCGLNINLDTAADQTAVYCCSTGSLSVPPAVVLIAGVVRLDREGCGGVGVLSVFCSMPCIRLSTELDVAQMFQYIIFIFQHNCR
jgi:hypothetical protein